MVFPRTPRRWRGPSWSTCSRRASWACGPRTPCPGPPGRSRRSTVR